jgi:LPS-assembly protein
VVISRGVIRLRARQASYDPATGVVDAAGGVLLTDATRALSAEGLHAVLDGDFEARGVVVFLKSGPVDLSKASTPDEAGACGRNALTAKAGLVGSAPGGNLRLEGARVTPCDCGAPSEAPSWELRADAALVHPGERVELTWPVLWITPRFLLMEKPVPVFAFPWVSLPLGSRVTGLLAPEIGTSGPTGLTLALPVFVTLGQSADLTLVPMYAFGRARSEVAAGKPSVRGPGVSAEGRWTPAVGVAGRLQADMNWDFDDDVGPLQGADGATGFRLALQGDWAQRFGARTSLRLDLDLVGDPLYVRDFTHDVLLRDATSRRSAVLLSHRREDVVAEASAAWLEAVSRSGSLAKDVDYGLFGGKLPVFHRWPALELAALPTQVLGPVRASGRVGVARFAPINGGTSDGGADGLGPGDRGWSRVQADDTELTHTWQLGERLAGTRADARAELAAPFQLWDAVAVTPAVRGAVAGYAFDSAVNPMAIAWGSAGVTATSALTRRFGGLRHVLEPRLEWLLTSAQAGDRLPTFAYDGWDRGEDGPLGWTPADPPDKSAAGPHWGRRFAAAAPPGVSNQLRLALGTRLMRGGEEVMRAEVGQELDLRRQALAEGWVRAAAARGYVSGEADVRFWTGGRLVKDDPPTYDSWLDAFSEIRVAMALADHRGDQLKASLLAVGKGGSGRMGAGVDDLFDPRPAGVDALASGSLAGRLQLGPAALGYEVLLPVRTSVVPACQGDGTRVASPWEVQQQTGSVEWDSPCRCFRARLAVRLNACGDLGASFSLDLGKAATLVGL